MGDDNDKSLTAWSARATLSPSFVVPAVPRGVIEPEAVVLTGATGFVGAFALEELLRRTRARIFCLVRGESAQSARDRLEAVLAKYRRSLDLTRVTVLRADLAQPGLGLSEEAFGRLSEEADAIIHCGAQVAFLQSYRQLEAANVEGTRELLRLAVTGRVKPFTHVSTISAAISGRESRCTETDDIDGQILHLKGGYAQTKWVAERLVAQAADRGLPVRIFRPGYVSGHTETGVSSTDDSRLALIKLCIELGAAPPLPTMLDMAPVDFVAAAIVACMCRGPLGPRVYNIFGEHPLSWDALLQSVIECGYAIAKVNLAEWRRRIGTPDVGRRKVDRVARQVLAFQAAGEAEWLLSRTSDVDCAHLRAALAEAEVAWPKLDGPMWRRYLEHLVEVDFIPPPPGRTRL